MPHIEEGQTKREELPVEGYEMVRGVMVGLHYVAIEKNGREVSRTWVKDYPHWSDAFDKAMDKAGI